MDLYILIMLFIIIFMLHNLEEVMTIERWFKEIYPRIRMRIPLTVQKELKSFESTTESQFSFVVFLLSIAFSIVILTSVITEHFFFFLGANIMFAINIFTHPLQALYLRSYTPGLLTALLLITPYNILFFYHVSNAGLLTINTILASSVVIVFLIIAFLVSHKIGEKWI